MCDLQPIRAQCRDCTKLNVPGLSPFQLAWAKDPGQKRWRDYPDVAANMTKEEIRLLMTEYNLFISFNMFL